MSTLDTSLHPPKQGIVDVVDSNISSNRYKLHFFLFMIMGSGANWVFPTALSQEIPYFEDHQPEGLCIATYMNACVNFGILALTAYLYINNNFVKIPYSYSVPLLLSISSIGCFITAATYDVTAGQVSIMLYFACAIGGTVGALAAVIMSPFLMSYENNMISAARSGGSAMILLTAIISAAQGPGSDNRFSVTAYMVIFGILLAFPIFAYYHIIRNNLHLRPTPAQEMEMSKHDSFALKETLANIDNPILVEKRGPSPTKTIRNIDEESKSGTIIEGDRGYDLSDENLATDLDYVYSPSKSGFECIFHDTLVAIIPKSVQKNNPWLIQAIPYMLAVAWTDFHTWGMLSAALPFAIAMTSPGDGSGNLAIAYEVGSFCLVSGDLTTTIFQIPFRYAISLFSIGALVIYLAAFNLSGFQSSAAAPFVIICYCVTQYLEAHMLTSAYRACASKFPHRYREDASRAVGIADQIGTCIGAIVSTVLISQVVAC